VWTSPTAERGRLNLSIDDTTAVESLANGVYTIVTSLGTLKIAASDIRAIQELGALQAAPVRVVKARR
jgi:hypothetical protein